MLSVKSLVETCSLPSVPSKYVFPFKSHDTTLAEESEVIPTIDFSFLTSGTPEQKSNVVQEIGCACREWGFFMVVNHGMPKKLMDDMLQTSQSFFDLTEEEKGEYRGEQLFDPIKYGTSFNASVDKSTFLEGSSQVIKIVQFRTCREISQEYCRRAREIAKELFKGISLSLGLEGNYVEKEMEIERGSQLLVVNLYPPCPQPEVAIGLPPHSDHGLLTLLIQNELGGLEVQHSGKWVPISPLPYSILVNTGDQMEVLTNGTYKSVVHRAMVNNRATRISLGTANGPPLGKVVQPAPEFVDGENRPAAYRGIKYKEYLELQYSKELNGKSCLDSIRV
ncbi:hypothetical protein RJ639_044409 [Escallonia herrerae]|uniref:Fe2OG dioxygenase domain-containing protein n=1 Tax=Escallonia herrerae TaxID=1293975 RepID=A0AA88WBY2_9ASTE|nr:hypothetical protein RJ639_044409 [Escallonia herrerae]